MNSPPPTDWNSVRHRREETFLPYGKKTGFFHSFLPSNICRAVPITQPTGKWGTKSLAVQHKVLNSAQTFIVAGHPGDFSPFLSLFYFVAKQTLYNLTRGPPPPPLGILQLSINEQTVFMGQGPLLSASWGLLLSCCVCCAPADTHI